MARFPLRAGIDFKAGQRGPVVRKPTGPTINRGKGNNNASTPMGFIRPVEVKFGKLDWDLAALKSNAKAPNYIGPDQIPEIDLDDRDSFKVKWHQLVGGSVEMASIVGNAVLGNVSKGWNLGGGTTLAMALRETRHNLDTYTRLTIRAGQQLGVDHTDTVKVE